MNTSLFSSKQKFNHGDTLRIGVLLTNLGTPDAPTPKALRRYLREFLSDPRVVELPKILWWLILNLFVLPFRPKKSAEAYSQVWTDQGSPLLTYSMSQKKKIKERLESLGLGHVIVEVGMRYGNPSIPSALQALREQGATKIIVLPLYP